MEEDKEIDIFSVIRTVNRFTREKRTLLLVILILSVGGFILKFSLSDPVFSSQMIVKTNSLPHPIVESINYPLVQSITRKNTKFISEKLQVEDKVAGCLIEVKTTEVKPLPEDPNKGTSFVLMLQSSSLDAFTGLDEKLLTYFNNLPYAKKKTEIRQGNLKKIDRDLNIQINRLDSIQQLLPRRIKSNSVGSSYDLGTIYQQMIQLKFQKNTVEEELMFSEEFILLSGFDSIKQEQSLVANIVLGLLAGFVICLGWFAFFAYSLLKNKAEGR